MITGAFQSVCILISVLIFYAIDFWSIGTYDTDRKAEGSGRSWDYTLMIFGVVAVVVAQPVVMPGLGVRVDAGWGVWVQVAGILLVAGGLALQGWARVHLRQFYAERVEVQPEHQIIESGPYAYIRHPIFTSFFMLVVGFLLINPALPTLLLAVYGFWDFTRAARQEEALLCRTLPQYAHYMERTWRFIPYLW